MPIEGELYSWNERNVNTIAQDAGVYTFYYRNGELIYIGSTENLRERFQDYRRNNFSDDPCKKDTTHYKREFTNNHEQREQELLEEYKQEHNRLPRCNDIIP